MDFHKEIRISYLGGFSILLVESLFWILSGILESFVSLNIAILTIIISGMFFYPLGLLAQFLLKRPKVSPTNPLNGLFTQISLIIPFSLPFIYLATQNNQNTFFSALTIIVGAHYLPFVYAYKLNSYWVLASILVIGGTLFGFFITDFSVYCAYFTGIILFIFAIINLVITKKEIIISK